MTLTITDSVAVSSLAAHLYDFLPASGNSVTSFPLAAAEAGLSEGWPEGKPSKLPAVTQLLTFTLEHRRARFGALILAIVTQSIKYRSSKPNPLTRAEVVRLNQLLLLLRFKLPELHDEAFLQVLSESSDSQASRHSNDAAQGTGVLRLEDARYKALTQELLHLASLAPHPRGYAFEKYLNDLFEAFRLAPRGAFRLVGEQIDGSFDLHHETFLLEAKWQNEKVGSAELRSFSGKVSDKATWTRGLLINNSGFSPDGLEAFGRGKPIILMDGLDLFEVLSRRLSLPDILASKVRRAAETGRPYVPVREL